MCHRLRDLQEAIEGQMYFTDDEALYVAGARHAGVRAHLFTGPETFAAQLNRLGIPVRLDATCADAA